MCPQRDEGESGFSRGGEMGHNPYYDHNKLDLQVVAFDETHLSYEFNTLIFVRPSGVVDRVYTARDSGCSCPTPFEDYEGETQEEVLQKMERVSSLDGAWRAYAEWTVKQYDGDASTYDPFDAGKIADWFDR